MFICWFDLLICACYSLRAFGRLSGAVLVVAFVALVLCISVVW